MKNRFNINKTKIKKACRTVISEWRVFLLMLAYMLFAYFFLGTSCLFASTVGLPCPGCGSTRALIMLFRNNPAGSFFYNPMLIPFAVVMAVYAAAWASGEDMPRWANRMVAGFGVLLISTYFIRMVTRFPNEPPMVYNYKAVLPRLVGLIKTFTDAVADKL